MKYLIETKLVFEIEGTKKQLEKVVKDLKKECNSIKVYILKGGVKRK